MSFPFSPSVLPPPVCEARRGEARLPTEPRPPEGERERERRPERPHQEERESGWKEVWRRKKKNREERERSSLRGSGRLCILDVVVIPFGLVGGLADVVVDTFITVKVRKVLSVAGMAERGRGRTRGTRGRGRDPKGLPFFCLERT